MSRGKKKTLPQPHGDSSQVGEAGEKTQLLVEVSHEVLCLSVCVCGLEERDSSSVVDRTTGSEGSVPGDLGQLKVIFNSSS